jgi:hypothetical protein
MDITQLFTDIANQIKFYSKLCDVTLFGTKKNADGIALILWKLSNSSNPFDISSFRSSVEGYIRDRIFINDGSYYIFTMIDVKCDNSGKFYKLSLTLNFIMVEYRSYINRLTNRLILSISSYLSNPEALFLLQSLAGVSEDLTSSVINSRYDLDLEPTLTVYIDLVKIDALNYCGMDTLCYVSYLPDSIISELNVNILKTWLCTYKGIQLYNRIFNITVNDDIIKEIIASIIISLRRDAPLILKYFVNEDTIPSMRLVLTPFEFLIKDTYEQRHIVIFWLLFMHVDDIFLISSVQKSFVIKLREILISLRMNKEFVTLLNKKYGLT